MKYICAIAILLFSSNGAEAGIRAVSAPELGIASWYHQNPNQKTASGDRFVPSGMTAAHRTLPFGSMVRVTDDGTGKSVIVRINDRGPFKIVSTKHGRKILPHPTRIIDLAEGAAKRLGVITGCKKPNCEPGVKPVRVEVLSIPTKIASK